MGRNGPSCGDLQAEHRPDAYLCRLLAGRLAALMDATPCVIYAAKSTEDRRGSIPDQLSDCRDAGERNHEDSRRRGLAIAAGRRRAAIRGDYLGNKPDGYRRVVELDAGGRVKKRLEIDPERRQVIETIFRMALRGSGGGEIARTLN